MKKQQRSLFLTFASCSLAVSIPTAIQAAGFAIVEQNVSGLGNAYAGASSIATDASTVFFNPAGMTQLSGSDFSAALHTITPSAKFSNNNSDITTGGDGGDAGGTEIVPNIYYTTPIGDETKFGVGINAPFGLSTEYDEGWRGRYHTIKSSVSSLNINPSIAFKTESPFSIGLGMNLQYLEAELTNALEFGAICYGAAAQTTLLSITDCNNAGLIPQIANVLPQSNTNDGSAKIDGDSWALGYNFGVLFAPTNDARVGFAYRSKMKHTLEGTADFEMPNAASSNPVLSGAFADTGATATITMPESWALSSYQKLASQWEMMGEITYTKWSRVQELVIEFDNVNKGPSEERLNFRNTYRYALGVNFKPDSHFTYRFGYAFDEGAAPNAIYRSPRVPDQDRTWLALGFGYKQNNLSFDLGYAHLFIEDSYINRESATQDTLNGKYEMSVDIFSAQFNYGF